ncbi:hypothetical protein F5Y14DRAFT_452230 [Nemania sp. NC0429]|nr:hypothetical protein F5Y14DRAFT_452230 [Nemania sp. NC0429]
MPDGDSQDVMSDNNLQDDKKSLLSRSTDSAEVEGYAYELRDRRNYKNRYWHALHLFVLYALVIGTSTALIVMSYKLKDPTLAVYSPAESAVSYRRTVLSYTKYAGPPTAERNKMWDNLHHRGVVTRISREEARKVTSNDTFELPDGEHLFQLEMFHQLHCLDTIRQTLYTQDFPGFSPYDSDGNPKKEVFEHLDHCVDRLLQGIMCASNTAPSMWHKETGTPREGAPVEEWLKLSHHHTLATCRNFKDIQQWAFEREQKGWEIRDHGAGIKMIT